MQITKATDFGLRVLMTLAQAPDQRTTVVELAERLEVRRHHLAKVVQRLAREGWVATARGRSGGLVITDAGLSVDVAGVVEAMEGTDPVVDCHTPLCPLVAPGCRLQGALSEAQAAFMQVLSRQTIRDLAT